MRTEEEKEEKENDWGRGGLRRRRMRMGRRRTEKVLYRPGLRRTEEED